MTTTMYPTLEHVAMQARPYPTHLLGDCRDAFCFFAAAFLGHNDAVHFAEAGIETTCIDTDKQRLDEMRKLYPSDWHYVVGDAWKVANKALTWNAVSGQYQRDIVSLDPFTGEMMEQVIQTRELWCSLARRYVVMGVPFDMSGYIEFPDGWAVAEVMPRSEIASWLVLERE